MFHIKRNMKSILNFLDCYSYFRIKLISILEKIVTLTILNGRIFQGRIFLQCKTSTAVGCLKESESNLQKEWLLTKYFAIFVEKTTCLICAE